MARSRAVRRERLGQEIAVADFGRIALVESDLQVVLDAAVSCCARSLGAEFAKVLRYVPERKVLVLQAGYGWGKEYIGMEFADADMDSAAGFALRTGEPVLSRDLLVEERFGRPSLLRQFDIRSAIHVLIRVEGQDYGIIEVDSPEANAFEDELEHSLEGFHKHLDALYQRHRHHQSRYADTRHSEVLMP